MSTNAEIAALSPSSSACRQCGTGEVEPGYAMQLCAPCRSALAGRSFPWWIKLSAVVIVGLLAAAILDLPSSLRAGVAFERGRRAEAASNYAAAIDEYQQVFKLFPDSNVVAARLAIACYLGRRPQEAAPAMRILSGRKLPKAMVDEINWAIKKMQRAWDD